MPPSAALILNGNVFSRTLGDLVLDMKARMQAGAYMWHYERFGVTPTVIRDALITISQVIEDYAEVAVYLASLLPAPLNSRAQPLKGVVKALSRSSDRFHDLHFVILDVL